MPLSRWSLSLWLLALLPGLTQASCAQDTHTIVRLAELQIDPAQLGAYKAALREEIDASIRLEPGVLTLYAVTLRDRPSEVRLFEQYASPEAYQAHIHTPHFMKYKQATAPMVRSLKLLEADKLLLGSKP